MDHRIVRRAALVGFATGIMVGTLGSFVRGTADAASACTSSFNSGYFDGFITDGTSQKNFEGVSADIRTEPADLCSGSSSYGNTSSTWAMVAENQSHRSTARGLAQVGYWFSYQNPNPDKAYFFYEGGANDPDEPHTWHAFAGSRPKGETHRYWVQWVTNGCQVATSACFAYNIDTTRLSTSSFNPYYYWGQPNGSTPWVIQTLSETHDPKSDVSGDDNGAATVWSDLQKQDWQSNNYGAVQATMAAVTDSSRYGLNYASDHGGGSWSTYTK